MAIKPMKPNERLGRRAITPTMSTGLPPSKKVIPGKLPNESGGRVPVKPLRNRGGSGIDPSIKVGGMNPLNRTPRKR